MRQRGAELRTFWRCALALLPLLWFSAARAEPASPSPLPEPPPAAVPVSITAPQADSGVVAFGDIKLLLELGQWNVERINQLLARAQAEFPEANARLSFLLQHFRRTPFAYGAELDIPPPGTLRVRLQTFGCSGLVLYLLAMTHAASFEEFVWRLRRLLYLQSETRGVDSDPLRGNMLDFPEDLLLTHAREQGVLTDVTAEVAGTTPLSTFRTLIAPQRRPAQEDPHHRIILPKLSVGKVLTLRMLSRAAFRHMDRSRIRTGDILLFSRIKPGAHPRRKLMFDHETIALNQEGEIYMIHASRDYIWRPEAKPGDAPHASGVFYKNDPRREQIGVGVATYWVHDKRGRRIRVGGKTYYGYTPDRLRPVYDYLAGARIQGVIVLRPSERTDAQAKLSSREAAQPASPLWPPGPETP